MHPTTGPDDDDIIPILDDGEAAPEDAGARWKVAIVDDDPAVHAGTRFALYDYRLAGRGLDLLSAHSAAEGRDLLRAHPDTAVVLLDVVMENDEAGLDLVEYIRDELRNETVRIILRTGQPGQAPERRVIVDYDINDYKAKTELTADKLFTAMTSALRAYQQLQRLVETRRGLEIIVEAASELFDFRSMQRLAEGVLTQIASLLQSPCAGILVVREGRAADGFTVLAGSGVYAAAVEAPQREGLDAAMQDMVRQAFVRRRHEFQSSRSVLYIETHAEHEIVVVVEAGRTLTDTDRALVEVFCSRLTIAFDNVILYERLQEANRRLEARVEERTRELSAANERLQDSSAALKRVNAYKNELLGKVAHDLKNPLGVILGRAEILEEVLKALPAAADGARSQVGHIREAADRLLAMVDTLITDARADTVDMALRRERLDLVRLVRGVVEANAPLAERKRQAITVEAPAQLGLRGDPDRLSEAIDNLVSNAIKYTPLDRPIRVVVASRGGEALVTVTDAGPGLSPEDRTRLFGRFQRLSAKPTGGESSTGLGLSIAKRIVDLHGGRISAEPAPGGAGSSFTIALPAEA